MKGKIVVMNKKCEFFVISFGKNKVSFESQYGFFSSEDIEACKLAVSDYLSCKELILLGNL